MECNLVNAAVRSLALSERIAKQIGAKEFENESIWIVKGPGMWEWNIPYLDINAVINAVISILGLRICNKDKVLWILL